MESSKRFTILNVRITGEIKFLTKEGTINFMGSAANMKLPTLMEMEVT